MTQKARGNVKYTIATHDAEKITLPREVITLCAKIADGHISGDTAVAEILRCHGIKRNRPHP